MFDAETLLRDASGKRLPLVKESKLVEYKRHLLARIDKVYYYNIFDYSPHMERWEDFRLHANRNDAAGREKSEERFSFAKELRKSAIFDAAIALVQKLGVDTADKRWYIARPYHRCNMPTLAKVVCDTMFHTIFFCSLAIIFIILAGIIQMRDMGYTGWQDGTGLRQNMQIFFSHYRQLLNFFAHL